MIIREKDKQELIKIFSTETHKFEVRAFGSRVNGKAHSGSDLDLVIISQSVNKMPMEIFTNLKEKISESNIPILVELFDWDRLPESFKQNILQQNELLFTNLYNKVSG